MALIFFCKSIVYICIIYSPACLIHHLFLKRRNFGKIKDSCNYCMKNMRNGIPCLLLLKGSVTTFYHIFFIPISTRVGNFHFLKSKQSVIQYCKDKLKQKISGRCFNEIPVLNYLQVYIFCWSTKY